MGGRDDDKKAGSRVEAALGEHRDCMKLVGRVEACLGAPDEDGPVPS